MEQTSSPTFGLVHSFYAIMGGFAFIPSCSVDTSTLKQGLFALPVQIGPDHPVRIPSFEGLVYIMKHFPHLIANISEEAILDRAQSNGLSKALLIVQVGWFCTNCASRLIQHLPLSLFEVSTAAHASCTLLTYFVWWSKPLNVPAPLIIVGNEAQEVCALLECPDWVYHEALIVAKRVAAGVPSQPKRGNSILVVKALQRLLRRGQTPEKPPSWPFGFNVDSSPGNHRARGKGTLYYLIVMVVSPMLYGLIHLLAWNDHFPTTLERRLWRVSSVVVTCSGLVGVTLGYYLIPRIRLCPDTLEQVIIALLSPFLIMMPALAHVLASGFLIVESIRQLYFLDPAAYHLPSWSNYWPHLT